MTVPNLKTENSESASDVLEAPREKLAEDYYLTTRYLAVRMTGKGSAVYKQYMHSIQIVVTCTRCVTMAILSEHVYFVTKWRTTGTHM